MASKQELIANLKAIFGEWETFLATQGDAEVTEKRGTKWSIKDEVGHLLAWQQISIARLLAAQHDRQPQYPAWLGGADPFYAEDHTGDFNAVIQKIYEPDSWQNVHNAWRDGFLQFLLLAEAIPEDKLFDNQRYEWLRGFPLASVLDGSLEHHTNHLQATRLLSAK